MKLQYVQYTALQHAVGTTGANAKELQREYDLGAIEDYNIPLSKSLVYDNWTCKYLHIHNTSYILFLLFFNKFEIIRTRSM